MTRRLIAYFAQNRVAANLLMIFIAVSGLLAASELSVQLFPNFDLRTITVTVPSPAATPKEVEQDINRRIEESITGLAGVERVVSVARDGLGKINIELKTFANADVVLDNVKSAVASIENFPPITADRPKVELVTTEYEVLTVAVSSESANEDELRLIAERIRNGLLDLPAVSHVSLHGVRDREIAIELDEEQLRRYGLTLSGVAKIINRNSLNLSSGELPTDAGSFVLHTIGKRSVGREFEDIPLITRLSGTVVTLGDVATIEDGFTDHQVFSRLNNAPAAFVRVDADENQSVAEISQIVRKWLASQSFPVHFKVEIWNDRATPAIERIRDLISNGVIGLILVFLCLVAVFDLRLAFWITLGIPLCFIGSLLFFDISGLTLNVGTIFAFFLLIGIVVDDAVVVGESIATERTMGKHSLEAAISGTAKVAGPLTIGVLTTVLAFVPFLFITAERYQVVNVIPYVAFFVLLVSLAEAFLILPAHLSHAKPWSLSPLREFQEKASKRLDQLRDMVVAPIVSWSIRHVVLTPLIAIVIVAASFTLITTGTVPLIVVDETRNVSDNIEAQIYYPAGTSFDRTLAAAQQFAQAARQVDSQLEGESIKSVAVIVGAPFSELRANESAGSNVNNSHLASVRIHLNPRPFRTVSVGEFKRLWQEEIGDTSSFARLEFQASRILAKPNIAYSLRLDDRDLLREAAAQFKNHLRNEPAVHSLNDNMTLGKLHFELRPTPKGVVAGFTPKIIGDQLRARFHGLEIQRIQRGHDEVKVVVRYPREGRENLSELLTMRINQPGSGNIPLVAVAEITETRELESLARINGEPVAFVNGFADEAIATPLQIRRKIAATIIPQLREQYPGLRVEVEGSARDEASMLKTLGILVPLVLLAMYVLVAAFLRSYWKPLVVVFGIPITLAGAIISHWILGWEFTVMSIFGVVGVLGVIVNDSLVLLDRFNHLRKESPDLPAIAAVSAAMRMRFRAVFLTSLTTILGLSPLLYERSEDLITLVPFVVSMLGGLVFASLFTLYILPTLVMVIEGFRE